MKRNISSFLRHCASAVIIVASVCGCSTVNDAVKGSWLESATPDWIGEKTPEKSKKSDADRFDVIHDTAEVEITPDALEGLTISEAAPMNEWTQEGGVSSQVQGHIKGSLLKEIVQTATIGEGNDWISNSLAASPVVSNDAVFAIDGHGIISAHQRNDISQIIWINNVLESSSPLLAGGLAVDDERLYAVTGHGMLTALDAKTGKKLWSRQLNEPIRSGVRIEGNRLFVTTAESRLLAYDVNKGTLLWQHQGIGESTNLFGGALPVVEADGVIVAYPSGEMFRLRASDSEMLWSDRLSRPRRTLAAGLFAGVDANPVSDGRLVYAASTAGLTIADDVRTGQRVWELPIGTRHSPWVDGALLFMVTDEAKLAAINANQGKIGWMQPLESASSEEAHRYFGPFLINDTLLTLSNAGMLYQYSPISGKVIRTESLVDSLASSPAFVGKDAYLVGSDATLYQVQ
jgi:outer membrane protein assembly factor BamB